MSTTRIGALWLGFEVGTSAADARKRFVEKYGVQPEQVKSGLGMILAGPVPEADAVAQVQG